MLFWHSRYHLIQGERATFPAKHKITLETQTIYSADCSGSHLKNQTLPDFRIGHRVQQQIRFIQGLTGKEDLRNEAAHPAWAENRKVNVWRTPPPVGCHDGVRARLDGLELVAAFSVSDDPSNTSEVWIDGCFEVVHLVRPHSPARFQSRRQGWESHLDPSPGRRPRCAGR